MKYKYYDTVMEAARIIKMLEDDGYNVLSVMVGIGTKDGSVSIGVLSQLTLEPWAEKHGFPVSTISNFYFGKYGQRRVDISDTIEVHQIIF